MNIKPWAKLERDKESKKIIGWLSLPDHCSDVAEMTAAILRIAGWQRVIARLAGIASDRLDKITCSRIIALAFLHDLGKANWGFQNKANRWPCDTAGHIKEVLALFKDEELGKAVRQILRLEYLDCWGSSCGPLLFAMLSHHGRPVGEEGEEYGDNRFWRSHENYDPFNSLGELRVMMHRRYASAFVEEGPALPDTSSFQHAFAGMLQLADWLGSDPRFFPLVKPHHIEARTDSNQLAELAISKVNLDPTEWQQELARKSLTFSEVFGRSPYPAQAAMTTDEFGSLVILESETGSGKTEASLWRFLSLFASGQVDGLYFALPTRVAATQIHERIRKTIQSVFPDGNGPKVVLAVPGYIRIDDLDGTPLPDFKVQWPDNPDDLEACRRWIAENPKRFLTATIAVGTIDQALLAALQVKHAHLRAFALARNLLVVDEVHASDTYMHEILTRLIQNHRRAGGHALLMSATLGSSVRQQYLNQNQGVDLPFDQAVTYPYPCITSESLSAPIPLQGNGHIKKVVLHQLPYMNDCKSIARKAIEAADAGAKVLIIRNTVNDAIATQQTIEEIAGDNCKLLFYCEDIVTLHHGRFAAEDRILLDKSIEAAFGHSRQDGGKIVVGTQTLEQSLDLDADLLMTDLCPIDVLLQRIGRLHRHKHRIRPSKFVRARALVLTPASRDLSQLLVRGVKTHGLGPVYDNLFILEATWKLLEDFPEIEIPAMNRMLVERATHPERLRDMVGTLSTLWQEHYTAVRGKTASKRTTAQLHLLDYDTPFGSLVFPDIDEKVCTRLGLDKRLAEFPEKIPSPFGKTIRGVPIPGHLARDIPKEAITDQIQYQPGVITFHWGGRHFIYDRLGLRLNEKL